MFVHRWICCSSATPEVRIWGPIDLQDGPNDLPLPSSFRGKAVLYYLVGASGRFPDGQSAEGNFGKVRELARHLA